MKLLLSALVVLSLLYLGHTAPVITCESLTQTISIESRDTLLGKWMYVGESTNMAGTRELTKKFVDSVFVQVHPLPDISSFEFKQVQKSFGVCATLSSTTVMVNNTLITNKPYKAVDHLLKTSCPDCLVVKSNFTLGTNYYSILQLLSRRRTLSTAELDEFKQQAKCLNLPEATFLNPDKELCSEEQLTDSTDLSSVMNTEMGSKILGLLDTAMKAPDGLASFMNDLLGNLAITKED
ncbi:hypothetical protein NQD34_000143 [Periophthalmus magnuspinnatus]|nr:hypothetical protein NQD34_000143 [Periophthalmus magnuspinnatus]